MFLDTLIARIMLLFLSVTSQGSFPPPLDPEEETRCFMLARQGDRKARAKLIEHNLRLVAHIVKKYYTGNRNQEDLMSIGTIGLIKAIDTFTRRTVRALHIRKPMPERNSLISVPKKNSR